MTIYIYACCIERLPSISCALAYTQYADYKPVIDSQIRMHIIRNIYSNYAY